MKETYGKSCFSKVPISNMQQLKQVTVSVPYNSEKSLYGKYLV